MAFSYVLGYLEQSPILRQQVESATASEVRLKGNIIIGVHAGSFRTIRGCTPDHNISSMLGDNYSAAWAETSFAAANIAYQRSDLANSAL